MGNSPQADAALSLLIDAGFVMAGPVFSGNMAKSERHKNVSRLWKKTPNGMVGIGTGCALSGDGLWRQHSWGLRREGILETTGERAKYFGVLLQRDDAESFAQANRVI